jgi:hypothetical protein
VSGMGYGTEPLMEVMEHTGSKEKENGKILGK